jgi:hypothetical protein
MEHPASILCRRQPEMPCNKIERTTALRAPPQTGLRDHRIVIADRDTCSIEVGRKNTKCGVVSQPEFRQRQAM